MKSLKTLAMFAVMMAVGLFAIEAFAAGSSSGDEDVFKTAAQTLANIFSNVRVIIYVLGAFGLIGIAVGGIMGAIKWKWLGALAMGLGIIACADIIVSYAIDSREDGGIVSDTATDVDTDIQFN